MDHALPSTPALRLSVTRKLYETELKGQSPLPTQSKKAGAPRLCEETVRTHEEFYERDDASRQAPEKKMLLHIGMQMDRNISGKLHTSLLQSKKHMSSFVKSILTCM